MLKSASEPPPGDFVGRQMAYLLSAKANLALRRLQYACDEVEHCRLARPVRTDEPQDCALF